MTPLEKIRLGVFDQYDNETWDEENYEDDAIEEDIETTRKAKVSTNPK